MADRLLRYICWRCGHRYTGKPAALEERPSGKLKPLCTDCAPPPR